MIKNSIGFIANYLWRSSIKNLSFHLTESELKVFSSNDYYYLTTIYYMNQPNFSQVAEVLNLTKPAISALVRKLIQLGLIEKKQSEEDKRIFYLSVTQKGKSIIDGDEELYKNFDLLIKNLASKEQYKLIETLLDQIVCKLEQQAD